jgi:hypothetical protein
MENKAQLATTRATAAEALQRSESTGGGAASGSVVKSGVLTLVAGTATVSYTGIKTGDSVFFSLEALNASPAVGTLEATITAGTGFTVQSYTPTGTDSTTDVTSWNYYVFSPS